MSNELPVDVAVKLMERCAEDVKAMLKGKSSLADIATTSCFVVIPGSMSGEGFIIQYEGVVLPLMEDVLSRLPETHKADSRLRSHLMDVLYRETLSRLLQTEKPLAVMSVFITTVSPYDTSGDSDDPGAAVPAILSILDMPGEESQSLVELIQFGPPQGGERISSVASWRVKDFVRSSDVTGEVRKAVRTNYVSVFDREPLDTSKLDTFVNFDEFVSAARQALTRTVVTMDGVTPGVRPTLH
jgi:hypothetical protein